MRRLFIAFVLGFFALVAAPVTADHQITFIHDTYGDLAQYNPIIKSRRGTATVYWSYEQDSGGVYAHAEVAQALQELSSDLGFFAVEVAPGTPGALRIFSSGGVEFIYGNAKHGGCGTWAIGCVTEFPTDPKLVIDTATMQPWGLRSRLEVALHELMHAIANLAEGYWEEYVYGAASCAPVDDGPPYAPGMHRSFMNCGLTNNQFVDWYVRFAWAYAHEIENPPPAWFGRHPDGTPFVYWENGSDSRARYVALVFSEPNGFWWSRPEYFAAINGQPYQGLIVPESPGRCVWVKQMHDGVGYYARYSIALVGCF